MSESKTLDLEQHIRHVEEAMLRPWGAPAARTLKVEVERLREELRRHKHAAASAVLWLEDLEVSCHPITQPESDQAASFWMTLGSLRQP